MSAFRRATPQKVGLGLSMAALLGFGTTAFATGEPQWQVVIEPAAGEQQDVQSLALTTTELAGRLQPYGVAAKLTATTLELSGNQGLEQMRNALFIEAADYADFLGGPVELSVSLPVGQKSVTLELETRPTTGYLWTVVPSAGSPWFQTDVDRVEMRYSGAGAPAVQKLTLSAIGRGGGMVTLAYRRPFEPETPVHATVKIKSLNALPEVNITNPAPVLLLDGAPPTDAGAATNTYTQFPLLALPASYDSRTASIVPPIRNQGGCGSCWAFGTAGIMEIAVKLGGGPLTDLSEQFLVSCNKDGWSCDGGWFANKYHRDILGYNQAAIGAVLEADKPYTATNGTCPSAYPHPYRASATQYITTQ